MTGPAGELPDSGQLLALALETAREAGELLVSGRPRRLAVDTKSSPTDVVTEMDTASERLITSRLLGARPGDGILGEEGAGETGTTGVRWVVDPIDGTVNYLYGLPTWAVSIAAESDGRALAGVVHAPALGLTWTATYDGEALCNGDVLSVSDCAELSQALVATGFSYRSERRRVAASRLPAILPVVRDLRRGGSAAIDLCFVAGGQHDAYFEQELKPWDRAAGALVVERAGGVVRGLRGAADEQMTLAGPAALVDALAELLTGLDTRLV
ncbi:MAG: inositol monophosphatase family protein [Actinomycetales bacterium]